MGMRVTRQVWITYWARMSADEIRSYWVDMDMGREKKIFGGGGDIRLKVDMDGLVWVIYLGFSFYFLSVLRLWGDRGIWMRGRARGC